MFSQTTKMPEKMPIIDARTPINLKLSPMFKRSFAYFTVKERLPIIITQIIDQLSRDRDEIIKNYGPNAESDIRTAMSSLVRLRNEIMTNKQIAYLKSKEPDASAWNNLIKEHDHPYYFTAVWLFTECYVYRRINEAFDLTSDIRTFDPFRKQKQKQYKDSIESMCYVSDQMISTWLAIGGGAKMSDYFHSLLKICLWSNKCDLSLSAGAESAQRLNPVQVIQSWEDNIIIDDFEKLFVYMRNASMVMQQFKDVQQKMQAQEKIEEEHRRHRLEMRAITVATAVTEEMKKPEQTSRTQATETTEEYDHNSEASHVESTQKDEAASLSDDQLDRDSSVPQTVDMRIPESDGPIDSEPDTMNASVPPDYESTASNADYAPSTTSVAYDDDLEEESEYSESIDEPVRLKKHLSHVIIDIVCDNAGYELFTDLCLADFLVTKGFCSKVRFRLKALPWFVSDATLYDFEWTVQVCSQVKYSKYIGKPGTEFNDNEKQAKRIHAKYIKSDNLVKLGTRWKNYLSEGLFEPVVDDFWTTSHDFSQLRRVDTNLYRSLGDAIFVFFKGDLNYRKLMGENNWNPTTSFTKALQGFHPSPICAIRTVKADLICGMKEGKMAEMLAVDEKWMETGNYGVIQACNKIIKLTQEELHPDTEES